ncbi:MAG: hypothetical protein RLZZ148_1244 [Cyanobacteriota bacterium]
MVTPTIGSIVLIPFPFSDLSQSKLRPTVILANAGKLFTASSNLIVAKVGELKQETIKKIIDAVIKLLLVNL